MAGFAAGVLALQLMPELPATWQLAVLVLLASCGIALSRRLCHGCIRALLHAGLGAALGLAWAATAAHVRLADQLDPSWEGRDVTITGVVAGLPQAIDRGLRFEMEVEGYAPAGATVPRRVLLSWSNGLDRAELQEVSPLRAGERWRFTVRLRRPHALSNPHGFDYEAWLLERGIRATGYVRPSGATRVDELAYRPAALLDRTRERLREKFWDALPTERHAGVLIALAIGDQRAIDAASWQLFSSTGVSHLMSISGLHVTMIAGLGAWLVLSLWRRSEWLALRLPAQKAACVAGFLAALAYCLLSGFAVPAQRTLYMVGAVALALWLDRNSAPSRVLALALGVVLLMDPWAVVSAGFWLSFTAVGLIFYVGAARPMPRGWLAQWGWVQWAMTVGLAPLMLALFGQVSLVSPLANALAIPLVSLAITPLALAGAVLPFEMPLHAAHLLMELLVPLLERLAALDAAVWRQHAPLPWTVPLALVGVAWLLAPRGVPGRGLGLVLMLPLCFMLPAPLRHGTAQLDFLDVGQGMAVSVRTRNHALLYDTGPAWGAAAEGADSGARVIVPFLRGEGVRQLDAVMVSHDDSDHSGGAQSVLAAVPTGVLLSTLPQEHPAQGLAAWRSPCLNGMAWTWDGVRFKVLHPDSARLSNPYGSLNDRSCVLRIETLRGAALLAGDIGRFVERELVTSTAKALRADVLLVPHHGSASSSTFEFVSAVSPRYAVVSAGHGNRFGHPRPEVVERYRRQGSVIVRTDTGGAWSFTLGDAPVSGVAWRDTRRRYWHQQ
jgi:competence protein ComEC